MREMESLSIMENHYHFRAKSPPNPLQAMAQLASPYTYIEGRRKPLKIPQHLNQEPAGPPLAKQTVKVKSPTP